MTDREWIEHARKLTGVLGHLVLGPQELTIVRRNLAVSHALTKKVFSAHEFGWCLTLNLAQAWDLLDELELGIARRVAQTLAGDPNPFF